MSRDSLYEYYEERLGTSSCDTGKKDEKEKKQSFLKLLTVPLAIIILILVILAGGYYIWQDKNKDFNWQGFKEIEAKSENLEESKGELDYINYEFGFKIQMLPEWQDYQTKKILTTEDGEQKIQIAFYLPIQKKIESELPGYAKIFAISIHKLDQEINKESSQRTNKDFNSTEDSHENSQQALTESEPIGKNNEYVFTYEAVNKELQSFIEKAVFLDFEHMKLRFEPFNQEQWQQEKNEEKEVEDDLEKMILIEQPKQNNDTNQPVYNVDFVNQALEYENCDFHYSIHYPNDWTKQELNKRKGGLMLQGSGVEIVIQALAIETKLDFQELRKEKATKTRGKIQSQQVYDWVNQVKVYDYIYSRPNRRVFYWQSSRNNEIFLMELVVSGRGMNKQSQTIENILGTLVTNFNYSAKCGK
ncbi:MAG: hypothetical protein GF332_03510 [Candidatus Moranbacteria bacterium]|nr:hypothetical protein [Candidatus Moranbacteria bacterium]